MFHSSFNVNRRKVLKWIDSSVGLLFLALLVLNFFDILITTPAYETNPVTIYLWGRMGFFLSALLKIGLVLFLGGLCQVTRIVATPPEWVFSRKLLRGILVVLVAFYTFVVLWNTIIFVFVSL